MPGFGGPQGGTRETCNWIAAAAVADGRPATLVDYVPVYASPIGAGFAYWPAIACGSSREDGRLALLLAALTAGAHHARERRDRSLRRPARDPAA